MCEHCRDLDGAARTGNLGILGATEMWEPCRYCEQGQEKKVEVIVEREVA